MSAELAGGEARESVRKVWFCVASERVDVDFGRGRVRTGTILAASAMIAGGEKDAAIARVRPGDVARASETPWQRNWLAPDRRHQRIFGRRGLVCVHRLDHMPRPDGFDYTERGGDVVITHHGKPATTLRGAKAAAFLEDAQLGDPQELMARLTANYRRGNERQARNHPRNRGR